MKRVVNFFTVSGVHGDKLNQMIAEFGDNIPKYCQYTGGSCGKLFCVDAKVDVRSIYTKYTGDTWFSIGFKTEIDDDKYNDSYMPVPTYNKDMPPYILEKIE